MARVVVIVNPAAARTSERGLAAVQGVFDAANWIVDIAETQAPGDATEMARKAAREGVDLVATYGGDGTMTEAVTGLNGTEVPVGLIPGGTGNVLAGNLRLPRDPEAAARVAVGGRTRALDLGKCTVSGKSRYFAVAAGCGYEADLMAETSSVAKERWGMGAYVAAGFMLALKVKSQPYRIAIDGVEYEFKASSVSVANCPEVIPPILPFRRGVKLDDGVLDVIIIRAENPIDSLRAGWQMLYGPPPNSKFITYLSGRAIRIEPETPETTEADGDVIGTTPLEAEVVPGGLHIVMGE